MKLAIDKNVPIPAYQQVVDGISVAVERGDVARGARLPSVRMLAVDLGLNVNTVARAYRDLERAGVVNTMPGMGTFVARETANGSVRRYGIPAIGAPLGGHPGGGPAGRGHVGQVGASWRDLLAAALALAAAEGVAGDEFLEHAARVVESGAQVAEFLVTGSTPGEAADLLRALPSELASAAVTCDLEALPDRLQAGSVAAVVTTFPGQARVRAHLGEAAPNVSLIPVETEYTEATVRALATLPPAARIALVAVERERWDEEANDIMKIIGRHRWLKMVLLDGGVRGLTERLEHLEAILYVPRASDAVEAFDTPGRVLVELSRQVTPRTRERLAQAGEAR